MTTINHLNATSTPQPSTTPSLPFDFDRYFNDNPRLQSIFDSLASEFLTATTQNNWGTDETVVNLTFQKLHAFILANIKAFRDASVLPSQMSNIMMASEFKRRFNLAVFHKLEGNDFIRFANNGPADEVVLRILDDEYGTFSAIDLAYAKQYYSNGYTTDAGFTSLEKFCYALPNWLDHSENPEWILYTVAGVTACWFCPPLMYVLAGAGVAKGIDAFESATQSKNNASQNNNPGERDLAEIRQYQAVTTVAVSALPVAYASRFAETPAYALKSGSTSLTPSSSSPVVPRTPAPAPQLSVVGAEVLTTLPDGAQVLSATPKSGSVPTTSTSGSWSHPVTEAMTTSPTAVDMAVEALFQPQPPQQLPVMAGNTPRTQPVNPSTQTPQAVSPSQNPSLLGVFGWNTVVGTDTLPSDSDQMPSDAFMGTSHPDDSLPALGAEKNHGEFPTEDPNSLPEGMEMTSKVSEFYLDRVKGKHYVLIGVENNAVNYPNNAFYYTESQPDNDNLYISEDDLLSLVALRITGNLNAVVVPDNYYARIKDLWPAFLGTLIPLSKVNNNTYKSYVENTTLDNRSYSPYLPERLNINADYVALYTLMYNELLRPGHYVSERTLALSVDRKDEKSFDANARDLINRIRDHLVKHAENVLRLSKQDAKDFSLNIIPRKPRNSGGYSVNLPALMGRKLDEQDEILVTSEESTVTPSNIREQLYATLINRYPSLGETQISISPLRNGSIVVKSKTSTALITPSKIKLLHNWTLEEYFNDPNSVFYSQLKTTEQPVEQPVEHPLYQIIFNSIIEKINEQYPGANMTLFSSNGVNYLFQVTKTDDEIQIMEYSLEGVVTVKTASVQ